MIILMPVEPAASIKFYIMRLISQAFLSAISTGFAFLLSRTPFSWLDARTLLQPASAAVLPLSP
jgi:hypothetical protein